MHETRIAFNGAFLRIPHCGMGDYTRNLLGSLCQEGGFAGAPILVPGEIAPADLIPDLAYVRHGRFTTLRDRMAFDQGSVLDFLKEVKPRLFHSMYASLPAASFPGKQVVTVGDMIPNLIWRYGSFADVLKANLALVRERFLPLIARTMNERGIKRADAILTFSECSKRDIVSCLNINPDKIKVVPIGVDPRLRPVPATEAEGVARKYGITGPYILYMGGFPPHKNVIGLLEAYRLLGADSNSTKLVLVGAYPPPRVRNTIAALGLTEQVILPGGIEGKDRSAIYSGAQFLVFPSFYEGFGLPPLEAMSCGCPVITSNTSSIPEVVGEAAITVNPRDVRALAEAMARLLGNAQLATTYRDQGLARARLFSWDRCVAETSDVYQRILTSDGLN